MSYLESIPPPEPDGAPSLLIGPDLTIHAADRGSERIFGIPAATLRGLDAAALFPQVEDLRAGLRAAAAAAAHVTTLRLEGRRASGVPFPAELQIVRRPGETAGEASGAALCVIRDLNADGLDTEARRYFDVAFDQAPIGMAVFNSDGEFVRVNESLCRLLGRRSDELLGVRDQELTHPEDRQRDVEAAWRILRGEIRSWQTEKRFIHAEGHDVWVIANLIFVRDERGRPLNWLGQFQDISERKRAELALRRERDYNAAILGGMHEGFMLICHGEILSVNDALCRLTGFAREELVGARAPFPFWPAESREEHMALRERTLTYGGADGEVRLSRRDGSRFHARVTASAADDRAGLLGGYVVTVRDETERRQHEERLAHLATHDPLTGLVNRGVFHERLHAEVEVAHRESRPLSLALLDLDRFKSINDTHGHQIGDRVLAEVGRRLSELCRANEPIARVGGEEFAWLLPGTAGVAAFAAAERARAAVERRPFEGVGRLTMSIGVCELADAGDADELYRLADVALYWAKAHGRDITFRYTAATAEELGQDPQLEDAERAFQARTLEAIARTIDAKHPTTAGHCARVAELAQRMARLADWSAPAAALLRDAALLHDIGKVAIPDAILLKPGPLSELEYTQVKTHAPIGAQMVGHVVGADQVSWIRHHHERWDGRGYPDGLAGEEIPAGAQILALADAWDAMTNTRHYRDARAHAEAVEEVRRQVGRQFSPCHLEHLLRAVARPGVTSG